MANLLDLDVQMVPLLAANLLELELLLAPLLAPLLAANIPEFKVRWAASLLKLEVLVPIISIQLGSSARACGHPMRVAISCSTFSFPLAKGAAMRAFGYRVRAARSCSTLTLLIAEGSATRAFGRRMRAARSCSTITFLVRAAMSC